MGRIYHNSDGFLMLWYVRVRRTNALTESNLDRICDDVCITHQLTQRE